MINISPEHHIEAPIKWTVFKPIIKDIGSKSEECPFNPFSTKMDKSHITSIHFDLNKIIKPTSERINDPISQKRKNRIPEVNFFVDVTLAFNVYV